MVYSIQHHVLHVRMVLYNNCNIWSWSSTTILVILSEGKLVKKTTLLFNLSYFQTHEMSSLLNLSEMCAKYGPPLPLDQ